MDDQAQTPPKDTLTQQIGVLTRREVEARILIPIIQALGEEFGESKVKRIVTETIIRIAREQGAELAEAMGGKDADAFLESLEYWTQNNALEIDIIEKNDRKLDFNVTRCRYSEMYRALGVPELGRVLSCNRDFALIEGFNPDARLSRTQTLMEGADHCNFRYEFLTAKERGEA